jgi:serine/threonine protein kinase
LADFGVSKQIVLQDNDNSQQLSVKGTTRFIPPELMYRGKYPIDPFKVDQYSFGVTMAELITRINISRSDIHDQLKNWTTKYKATFLYDMVQRCLHEDPSKRETFDQICESLLEHMEKVEQ